MLVPLVLQGLMCEWLRKELGTLMEIKITPKDQVRFFPPACPIVLQPPTAWKEWVSVLGRNAAFEEMSQIILLESSW